MSSFLRKRVRGLLRQTFSSPGSNDADSPTIDYGVCDNGPGSTLDSCPGPLYAQDRSSVIYEKILNGKNGRKVAIPETYSGKTGLDIPVIQLAEFSASVRSCYTGPEGGLTKVQQMRQQPIVRMANLDDELSLSSIDDEVDDDDVDLDDQEASGREPYRQKPNGFMAPKNALGVVESTSMEALGFSAGDLLPGTSTNTYNWNTSDEQRAFGLSTSLYERHPITGMSAGLPIADVFAIIARENNAILALADGVNWGEGARLAARCAVRGAVDHLNAAIENSRFETSRDVFHALLGAFHAGHALILQEGGALTTLCVALVAPVKNSDSFVLCVCNVGDSLCFVQNPAYGVREITLGSHDIGQMRDMRDAGGALGPVDGRNPQLHNLTCSMTFVEEGEIVYITSDGVSDNFDPVVGRFCVIRKSDSEKENLMTPEEEKPPKPQAVPFHKSKSAPSNNHIIPLLPATRQKHCSATLPCVDAVERHELMLLRMADVISNGIGPLDKAKFGIGGPQRSPYYIEDQTQNCSNSPSVNGTYKAASSSTSSSDAKEFKTASEVCRNLVHFATQLSTAKRRTLEDPELYRTRTHSKTEERLRRKMIRNMIMEMPGKLDHASVVAFRVGMWDDEPLSTARPDDNGTPEEPATPLAVINGLHNGTGIHLSGQNVSDNGHFERSSGGLAQVHERPPITEVTLAMRLQKVPPSAQATKTLVQEESIVATQKMRRLDMPLELEGAAVYRSPTHSRRSPYEDQPVSFEAAVRPLAAVENVSSVPSDGANGGYPVTPRPLKNKKHRRGSVARHTLGVDVAWLKRLITNRHSGNDGGESSTAAENRHAKTPSASPAHKSTKPPVPPADIADNGHVRFRNGGETSPTNGNEGSRNFSLKKLKGLVRGNRASSALPEEHLVVTRSRDGSTTASLKAKRLSQPPESMVPPLVLKVSSRV